MLSSLLSRLAFLGGPKVRPAVWRLNEEAGHLFAFAFLLHDTLGCDQCGAQ